MTGIIDIQDYMEHEDGSATIIFECNDEAKKALINEGLLSLIEKAIDKHNEEYALTSQDKEQLEFDFEKGESKDED